MAIDHNKKIEILAALRDYFRERKEVEMAFIFGSWARNQEGAESDLDIAVYFKPRSAALEWQTTDAAYSEEKTIWLDIERIAGTETDLLVLNRAPATVTETALKGLPLVVKNRNRFMDLLLRTTSEATDFREWVHDYWMLKENRRRESAA